MQKNLSPAFQVVALILIMSTAITCAALKWNSNFQVYAEVQMFGHWMQFKNVADAGIEDSACDTCRDTYFQREKAFDKQLEEIIAKRDEKLEKLGICSWGGWKVSLHLPAPRKAHNDSWYYPCRASSIVGSFFK